MRGFIIAIRNFIIALLLSWVGINFSVPDDDSAARPDPAEETLKPARKANARIS